MLYLFASILLNSFASICGKMVGLTSVGKGLAGLLFNFWFVTEMFTLGLSAITWTIVLRKFPLTFAYPFMSLIIAVNLFSAWFFFAETITGSQIIGTIVIIAGVAIIATTQDEQLV